MSGQKQILAQKGELTVSHETWTAKNGQPAESVKIQKVTVFNNEAKVSYISIGVKDYKELIVELYNKLAK